MDYISLFFAALLLGLFALIASELIGRLVGWLVSLVRPDLDPSDLSTYIQRVGIVIATTSWAWHLEDSFGAILLLAGASASVALALMSWLARPSVVIPTTAGRRR
jgi:hypothetical protein